MSEYFSQDEAINHDALVASYTPEMLAARDELIGVVESLRNQLGAADALGQVPPRVGYHVYEDGTIAIDLGRFSTDPSEALAQFSTEKAFASITGSPDSTDDLTVITIRGDQQPEAVDPTLPIVEEPVVKVVSSKSRGNKTTLTTLAIYPDGYVESSSETTRSELVHPPGASDLAKKYAKPSLREVTVLHTATKPAEAGDVQKTKAALESSATRYGVNL